MLFADLTSLKKLNLDRLRRLGESHFSGAINVFANLGALEELTMNQMVIRAGFDMGADFFAGLTSLKVSALRENSDLSPGARRPRESDHSFFTSVGVLGQGGRRPVWFAAVNTFGCWLH